MTLNRKINHANEISVLKPWSHEFMQKAYEGREKCITWSLCDHVTNAVILGRLTRNPREFPTLYSEADINELWGLLVPGGLLVNTWQMSSLRHRGATKVWRHSGTQEVKF